MTKRELIIALEALDCSDDTEVIIRNPGDWECGSTYYSVDSDIELGKNSIQDQGIVISMAGITCDY